MDNYYAQQYETSYGWDEESIIAFCVLLTFPVCLEHVCLKVAWTERMDVAERKKK